MHIVGLGIQLDSPALAQALDNQRERRRIRAEQILERAAALGMPINRDKVMALADKKGTLGRMHIAWEIVELGYAKTVQEAFDTYLNPGRPLYVPRTRIPCREAVERIHEAGGLALVAHPGFGAAAKLLDRLLRLPFDGIEAYHCKHTPGQVGELTQLASEHGLLIAGGSDCHGAAKAEPEMGRVRVPYGYFERILSALASSVNP